MPRITRIPFLLALAGLIACSENTSGPATGTGDAGLAVLNAMDSEHLATLRLDGQALALPLPGSAFGLAISSGSHLLEALDGTGNVLKSASFAVPAGARRTALIAGGTTANLSMLVASDTAALPPANAAKIRVVHMAQGAQPLDAYLFLTGAPVDSSAHFVTPFNYGTGTNSMFPGYAVRPLGVYTVRVAAPGSTTAVAETQVTLGNGQVWSVVLSWNTAGVLELKPIVEGPMQ